MSVKNQTKMTMMYSYFFLEVFLIKLSFFFSVSFLSANDILQVSSGISSLCFLVVNNGVYNRQVGFVWVCEQLQSTTMHVCVYIRASATASLGDSQ